MAIRWLTSVRSVSQWGLEDDEDEETGTDDSRMHKAERVKKSGGETQGRRDNRRLSLAICAGTASAGPHLSHLRCSLSATGSVGAIAIHSQSCSFDKPILPIPSDPRARAGTGLVSLAIASFCQHLLNRQTHISQHGSGRRDVEIVATDYHPSVLENLKVNLKSNGFDAVPDEDKRGSFDIKPLVKHFTKCLLEGLPCWICRPFPRQSRPLLHHSRPMTPHWTNCSIWQFGADIVYEEQHAVWFKRAPQEALVQVAGRCRNIGSAEEGELGDEDPNAYFHLIIPLRPTHTFESGTIETVFKSMPHATNGDPGKDEMQRGTW
ncbi:hypothetical protein BKA70DRAFT_1491233 [Coprinopsis sp. MPI-PUGE-AT-0042]|nr:hypothetical protein BKA70DRAFT_1491233 [Coprinopsis sp. MPI-PUGE-AT-0042]